MVGEQRHLAARKRGLEVLNLLNCAADVVATFDNEETRAICETTQVNLLKVGLSCNDPEIRQVKRPRNTLTPQGTRPNEESFVWRPAQ